MVMAAIIPKNTPVPIEWRLADPGPDAMTRGNIPNTKASEVIRIGRKRNMAAFLAADLKIHAHAQYVKPVGPTGVRLFGYDHITNLNVHSSTAFL